MLHADCGWDHLQLTNLAGFKAKNYILYDYDKDSFGGPGSTLKVMRVLALDNNGNGYAIKYAADPGMFDKYLPVAKKMIGSFEMNTESSLDNNDLNLVLAQAQKSMKNIK